MPATLSLTLGTPATFGAFTPGVARDYIASTTATVISTAGDATLSVADPSSTNTGHLVNGAFFLPQKLQAGTGAALAPVGGSAAPTTAEDVVPARPPTRRVTVNFKQSIGANDAAPHGRLQQDADVHALDDEPVIECAHSRSTFACSGSRPAAGSTLTSSVGPVRRLAHSWQCVVVGVVDPRQRPLRPGVGVDPGQLPVLGLALREADVRPAPREPEQVRQVLVRAVLPAGAPDALEVRRSWASAAAARGESQCGMPSTSVAISPSVVAPP